jgi:hypothetical protein
MRQAQTATQTSIDGLNIVFDQLLESNGILGRIYEVLNHKMIGTAISNIELRVLSDALRNLTALFIF